MVTDETEHRLPRLELSKLMGQTMGVEKADAVVAEAMASLSLSATDVNQQEALRILEHIASQPGLVGISARFAKGRVHLRWSGG